MKRFSTIFVPGLVLLAAVLTGGWFLQQGVTQEKNVYYQVRLFEEVMGHVLSSYVDPVDRDQLYQSAIQGVLEELGDPNTSFMPASTVDDFRIRMEGEYGGVGLEVIPRDGWVTVVTPLPGTPGTRAGVRAGDQIVEVEGESTAEWDPDDVVDSLRGQPGTAVSVAVRRPGVEVPIPFTITREVIRLKSVPFATELQNGVGYVPLQTVSETSFQEVRRAVDSLKADGVEDLILDLRGNTGGALDQGIAITDFFLDPNLMVVETRGRASGQSQTFQASQVQHYPGMRVVVLVDERSASASEIIAGALQDHDRALVVGAPSFGKGSVQTLYPLPGGNILRLTTARWYTPLGRSIHKDREHQIRAMEHSALTLSGVLASLPDTTPKPVYQTSNDRHVFGGGGIVPDVLVMADTLTLREREGILELDRNAGQFVTTVFNFAVDYLQEHPDLDMDFQLTAGDLDAFREDLAANGMEFGSRAFQATERFIRYQLESEIALRAWGDKGQFLRMAPTDRALQRALDLLEASQSTEDLLELALDPDRSDWMPSAVLDQPVTDSLPGSGS
jgi:carboxyl-terminal processing protease